MPITNRSLRRPLAAFAVVCGGASAGAVAFAQDGAAGQDAGGVLIALGLSEGDTFAYRLETELTIEQTGSQGEDGASELPLQDLEYEADVRFTVVSVGPDGAAEVRASFFAYEAEWSQGETEADFERNDLEALRGRLGEVFDDPGDITPADRLFVTLARTTPVLTIGADGTITGVTGFEQFASAVRASDEVDDRFLGFMTNQQFAEIVGPIFAVDGANGVRLTDDATWRTTKTVDLSNIAVLDFAYDWSVDEISEADVSFDADATITVRRPTTPDPIRPDIELLESSESVEVVWDRSTNRVASRDAEFAVAFTLSWSGEEQSISVTQRSEGSTEIEAIALEQLGADEDEDEEEGEGADDGGDENGED